MLFFVEILSDGGILLFVVESSLSDTFSIRFYFLKFRKYRNIRYFGIIFYFSF